MFHPLDKEFAERFGEIHRLVGPDCHPFHAQCVNRVIGDSIRLIIVAKWRHKHIITDPLWQHRMGGTGGDERNTFFLKQGCAGHNKRGIRHTNTGYHVLRQCPLGGFGGFLLIGFGIDGNEFKRAAQQPASGIDLLDCQLGTL